MDRVNRRRAGLLLVAVVAAAAGVALAWRSWEKPWRADKVVLITIDTLRADRLGFFGYRAQPTTPKLDAWAGRAVVFENAFSQAPWTVPSLGSLFAGRYPVEVGVYSNRGGISPDLATLPELFRRHGFRTASFNTHALLVNDSGGFRRGFDEVFPARIRPVKRSEHKIPWTDTEPYLMQWLESNAQKERFFLWIHSMDPHAPPTAGNTYIGKQGWHSYDAEVRWVDAAMGRILAKLDELGIRDESLVVFTADHGEAFGEHKLRGHQDVMYDEVLRVPLIVEVPTTSAPVRITEPVELLDLFPTIAEYAGLPLPAGTRGESLVPLIEGRSQRRKKPYLFSSRFHFEDGHHELAVRDRDWKLLLRTVPEDGVQDKRPAIRERRRPDPSLGAGGESKELYRWGADRGETSNLLAKESDETRRLKKVLGGWWSLVGQPPDKPRRAAPELDAASLEALRALGYE